MRTVRALACLCVLVLSAVSSAGAQPAISPAPATTPPAEIEPSIPAPAEGAPVVPPPTGQIYGTPSYRRLAEPFGTVLGPPATRAPISLIPSLTVGEEFNDNIFFDNLNRRSDFITSFTPGLAFLLQQPTYRLAAAYSVTAEVYARHSELNNVGDRQSFVLDGLWDVSPRLSLTLNDLFVRSYSTPRASEEGLATGRTQFWTNTIAPGLAYRLDPLTTVRVVGAHTVTRIDDVNGANTDSDTYRAETVVERALTPRLTATVGYQFAYFDFEEAPSATTHTPRLGAMYRVTPTLTVAASAGPTIQTRQGQTDVSPAATASVIQQFSFGSASLTYNRSVGAPGTLAETTENQTIGAALLVTNLFRGFVVTLAPRYSTIEGDTLDTRTFVLDLSASYQLTSWLWAFGSYTFFRQRSDGQGVLGDIDQNRVFVGLQVRYPIDLR